MVNLREASPNDKDRILEWRNDSVSLANSLNDKPVSTPTHNIWFEKTLADADKFIFLGYDADPDTPFGMVRFDVNPHHNQADVSINLAPEARGRGLGKLLLSAGIKKFLSHRTCILSAKIKPENKASIACFKSNDFIVYDETPQQLILKNKIVIIDAIEAVRTRNNVNWMDIMRVAMRSAPQDAEKIIGRINNDDGEISRLLSLLSAQSDEATEASVDKAAE